MRPVVSLLLLGLLATLPLPGKPARAGEGGAASAPGVLGDGVGPRRHGFWPVRVQDLQAIRWKQRTGKYLGMVLPSPAGGLVAQGGGGAIHALDATSGAIRWTAPGNPSYFNYSACCVDAEGNAYGGNFDAIRAVDAEGRTRWQTPLKCRWLHGPPALAPDGRTVYVGGDGLGIAALDTATGAVEWMRRDFTSSWNEYVFPGDGSLIVATDAGVFAFAEDGAERWHLPEVLRKPMLVGDLLVAADAQGLSARRLADRTVAWSWPSGAGQKVVGLACGDDGRIRVALLGGDLACLEPTGHLRWRRRLSPTALYRIATVEGGETLVADANGVLMLVDSNGRVLASVETGDQPWRWRPSVGSDGAVYLGHRQRLVCVGGERRPPPVPVVASSLVVVADDFVVDVWVNGEKLPLDQRTLLAEIHGATSERISVDLHEGDWIVFHVVANRLRWNGASYFGVHAAAPDGRTAFVSRVDDAWVACDEPADVAAFLATPGQGQDRGVRPPARPWSDAPRIWRDQLGAPFEGEPVWGEAPSTWIKYVVGPPLPTRAPDPHAPPPPPAPHVDLPTGPILALVEEVASEGARRVSTILVRPSGAYVWTRYDTGPVDGGAREFTGQLPEEALERLQLGFQGLDPRVVVRFGEAEAAPRRGIRMLRRYLYAKHASPPPPAEREPPPPAPH